jgi:hypothetical protein
MGISMRHVVWCSATLSLGAFFYVLTMEPMDQRRNPRAAAIERVPPRNTLVTNIRRTLGQGQLLAADRQSEVLLANYPDDLDAIYFRAIVEREMGLEEQVARRWAFLDQQTASLEMWPARYSQAQIGYYRAWALVGTGRVEEGQLMFRDLADQIQQIPDPYDREGLRQYNLACYRAMGGQPDAALTHWASAVEAGYGQDGGWWMVDPDLESLQGDDRFWAIGAQLIQRENEADRRDGRREDLRDDDEPEPDKQFDEGSDG